MAYPKAADFTPRLNPSYEGRYPTLDDMLRQGGIPGYNYYLAHATQVGHYQSQGADMVKDMPALNITGPKGTATAFLMCKGEPIEGADPLNGIRHYFIDPLLDTDTGLDALEHLHVQDHIYAPAGNPGKVSKSAAKSEGNEAVA